MNYIFLDLEFNRPTGRVNPKLSFEIMEIGAVKTDEDLNIIDTFRVYVKNTVYKSINKYVAKLTGITLEDLKYGFVFNEAYRMFRNWIGEEEFNVFSYSNQDEIVLNWNLDYNNLSDEKFEKIIDVQNEVMVKMNMSRHPSLKDLCAIYEVDIDETKAHKALFDTIMLAKAYKEFISSPYTGLEMRDKVDEKYRDLFDITMNITFEEAKNIDKRKYKVTCPECKKQLKKESIYYNSKTKCIQTYSKCNDCKRNVYMVFKVRRNIITNDYVLLKAKYKDSMNRENKKYTLIK